LILFKRNRLNSIRYCAVMEDGAIGNTRTYVPAQLEKLEERRRASRRMALL
jgi:hypothetical protein